MSASMSVGIPFFRDIKFYHRGDFSYFINPDVGTWVALPSYQTKILFAEQYTRSHSAEYVQVYEALARNNIISDRCLNKSNPTLEIKPLLVKFQSTGKCNLNCSYCFNSSNIRTKSMNLETMHRAVDYCFESSFAREQAPIFLIYGGEPMIDRNRLFETVKYIRSKADASHIGIITNATLLTEEDIIFFKAYDVHIGISFDGLPEFHAKNRHGTTDLSASDKVLSNIDLLNKHDYMSKSYVLCVVTREMSSRLLECVLFLQERGVLSMEFLTMNLLGDAKTMRVQSTSIPEFIASLKKIVEAIEDSRIRRLRMRNILRLLLPLVSTQNIKGELCGHRCGAGRNIIAITTEGKILACDMIPKKFHPEIGDVWSGIISLDKLDNKIAPYASDDCKKCTWRYFCRSGCTGACAGDNGDLNVCHALTCAMHKEMYPYLLEKIATDSGMLRDYFDKSTRHFPQ